MQDNTQAAERFVERREAELRRLIAGIPATDLARVDLDTAEGVEEFLAQRRVEFRAMIGLAS